MPVTKDYYKILNVTSSASPGEIKNAYRKLAMKYHPDRNPGDTLAAAVFSEAAEAYKILSNAETRRQYNYERTLTAEEEYKRPVETIETLIQRIHKINQQAKAADPFRFNKDALLYSIKQLFPGNIELLLKANSELVSEFLQLVCNAANYLSSYQTKKLIVFTQPLFREHAWLQDSLQVTLHRQEKTEHWEKNKIVLAVIVAMLLCAVIFLVARK
ncbi:MAG: J domain-containing protein [Parafilimonas sp.]|nr:J domain-containing protein [Parafilimonas sp.]